MKDIIKKYSFLHILNLLGYSSTIIIFLMIFSCSLLYIIIPIIVLFIITLLSIEYKINKTFQNKILEKENEYNLRREVEFQESLKNIYDEHIFSITHELRTPLAVMNSCLHNTYYNLKVLYSQLNKDQKELFDKNFKNSKQYIKTINSQVDIIQNFISSISEYASYVSDKNQNIINLQTYLISIILNSPAYSRNMKIFNIDAIGFLDSNGIDFENIHCIIKPHDLTRMIINIMTNSADAISKIYKIKKLEDKNYKPYLKIRCIKSKDPQNKILLNNDFMRVNGSYEDAQSFYLVIEDNGPGISTEHIKKIFQYGVSSKKDDASDNLNVHHGLGLYITLKLAELNGIKIYIKTNQSGTMIVLGLPNIKYTESVCSDDCIKLYNKFVKEELYNSKFTKVESDYHKILNEKGVDDDTNTFYKRKTAVYKKLD